MWSPVFTDGTWKGKSNLKSFTFIKSNELMMLAFWWTGCLWPTPIPIEYKTPQCYYSGLPGLWWNLKKTDKHSHLKTICQQVRLPWLSPDGVLWPSYTKRPRSQEHATTPLWLLRFYSSYKKCVCDFEIIRKVVKFMASVSCRLSARVLN